MDINEIIEYLKVIKFIQPETPLGIVIDNHKFSIISKSNFVAVSVDDEDFIEIPKFEFMDTEGLCNDTKFYIENGDMDSAQSCIECALRVDDKADEEEKNWEVYFYAGFVALRQRMFDASINLIQRSMELGCNELRKCYDFMAISSSILGRTDEALNYYKLAIEETPEDPEVYHNIAGFYWDNNMLDKALKSYIKALECNIEYMKTYEEIINLTSQLGNNELSNLFKECYNKQACITKEQLLKIKNGVTND